MKKYNFKCPVCRSSEVEKTTTPDDTQYLGGIIVYPTLGSTGSVVVICKKCGVVYKPKAEVTE